MNLNEVADKVFLETPLLGGFAKKASHRTNNINNAPPPTFKVLLAQESERCLQEIRFSQESNRLPCLVEINNVFKYNDDEESADEDGGSVDAADEDTASAKENTRIKTMVAFLGSLMKAIEYGGFVIVNRDRLLTCVASGKFVFVVTAPTTGVQTVASSYLSSTAEKQQQLKTCEHTPQQRQTEFLETIFKDQPLRKQVEIERSTKLFCALEAL